MKRSPRLEPGSWVPEFTAEDELGRLVTMADFSERWLVLFFYVGDGRPGCIAQALGFRNHFEAIHAEGAVVLGLSADSPDSHAVFKAEHKLPFTLLTDEDHALARAYGAWGTRTILGQRVTGVLRSHFVVSPRGQLLALRLGVGASDSARLALEALQEREL